MMRALVADGHEVVPIIPAISRSTIYLHARKAMYRAVGQHFHAERQKSIAQELALSVDQQLRTLPFEPDLVLGSSSLPMAYLRTTLPTAFWTDATFASMLHFYDEFSHLSNETIRSGMEVEERALARCDHAFYSSAWAARSAVKDHGADPRKTHVVPFGPNLDHEPRRDEVLDAIEERSRKICKLLFVGYDWTRKQGELVVRVQRLLEGMGVPAELIIIGCEPEIEQRHRRVRVVGKLDKNTPEDLGLLQHAFLTSHFLMVPSLAECYGMVYAEASAYGSPSIACNVGGVEAVVSHGRNGLLFEPGVDALLVAEHIAAIWKDEAAYRAMARAARDEFDDRLNWGSGIASLTRKLTVKKAEIVS